MSMNSIALHGTERWITQIVGGVVTQVQRIDAGAVVVRVQDLPDLCANVDFVSDELAVRIEGAMKGRV